MEQSHAAVMIVDLDHRIEYANRRFCTQTGYVRREMIGRSWRDFLNETMPAELAAEMTAVIRVESSWHQEWTNRRKDGSTYPVRGIVTAVHGRHDQTTCYVAVYEDMTEIRRNEAILREARDQAEAGDRAKSHFLATMSHEVRTPLNGIVGFTNLLLETTLTPEQREYMQTIRSSGEALIQLTNDILDFARIESGKLKLELQPCDIRESIEDALDLLATRASEKKLELLHWVDENVPPIVQTDPGRLRQELINLVNNAVKFTEIGEVGVAVSARALPAGTEAGPRQWELTFSVRDTGIGIDAAHYGKLFRPFSQLEDASTRRYGGTGLGLAISSNLVQLMGGKIDLQSEPGVGSTFSFTITVEEIDLSAGPAKVAPPNIAGVRLLLVDQPGALRRELARLTQSWGALVTEATPDDLSAHTWDVALVDVDEAMANELSKWPDTRPNLPREKMLALVPLGLPPAVRAALRPHFRLLINKPVHHEALRALLAAPVDTRSSSIPFASANSFDLRVLLVEDNPVNQRLMQKVLANLGCRWTVAENGRIALDELRRAEFDLVLMDLHMPEMDGITAIQQIRAGHAGAGAGAIWITALTADARLDQRERVVAAGANDYLIKPVRSDDMDRMFHRFLEARRAPPV
jgi:PAS domain S-box-containing protein